MLRDAGAPGRDMVTLSLSEPELWERFQADLLRRRDRTQNAVLARWERARRLKRRPPPPTRAAVELAARRQAAALVVQGLDELETAFLPLHARGFALVLADHEGRVLTSRRSELLGEAGARDGVRDGSSLAECDFGTNAVGTALAEERPIAVVGDAHYAVDARRMCCYAAPIRDGAGRIGAVLDFTGPAHEADPLVGAVVLCLATAIESALRLRRADDGQLHLGMLSHDLRSPLGAVRMGSELLQRHGDPLVARIASRIATSAARMQRMVSELLDSARDGAGAFASARQPANLCELSQKVVDELRLAHPDRTLTLDCAGDVDGCWDCDRLMRVIENLVGNALTHGHPDTPVAVTVAAHAHELTLEVTNEGPPIPKALRSHLFDPYCRGNTRADGRGLGLYIARNIVLAHGGSITLDCDDRFTRFRVRLPR